MLFRSGKAFRLREAGRDAWGGVSMNPFKSRSEKVKSPFAEFIRNAKAEEKRVYTAVLVEATKRQNEIIVAAQEKSV